MSPHPLGNEPGKDANSGRRDRGPESERRRSPPSPEKEHDRPDISKNYLHNRDNDTLWQLEHKVTQPKHTQFVTLSED